MSPGTGTAFETLTVAGNATFSGGVFQTFLASCGGNSSLSVQGAATISAGAFVQSIGAGTVGIQYTILQAAGGVSGSFSSASTNIPGLTAQLTYDEDEVFLTLIQALIPPGILKFAPFALTPNQTAVAGALDNPLATDPASDTITQLAAVPTSFYPKLLQTLSGDAFPGMASVSLKLLNQLQSILSDRMHLLGAANFFGEGVATANSRLAPAALLGGPAPVLPQQLGFGTSEWSGWVRGFGSRGDLDSTANATGLTFSQSGVMAGFDRKLSDRSFLGFSGSYNQTDANAFDVIASQRADGYSLGVYGGYKLGSDSYLLTSSLFAHANNDTTRTLAFGAINATALASFNSNSSSTYAEVGKHLRSGDLRIDPHVSLEYDRVRQNGFNEMGAGVLNLAMAGTRAESFLASRGVRLYRTYVSDGGTVFTPELKLRYVHDFEDSNPVVFAALPGLSPTVFAISGVRPAQDFAVAGASVAVRLKSDLDGYLAYNGQYASEQTLHAGEGGVRLRF